MMGQVLPGNNQYNFNGVLDDIRIYNYALSYGTIRSLYDIVTDINEPQNSEVTDYLLQQNYPNPFNSQTLIRYQIKEAGKVILKIYDALGSNIRTLSDGYKDKGVYSQVWDGKDKYGRYVATGIYFYTISAGSFIQTKKMLLLK